MATMARAAGNRMSIIASAASRYRLTRPPPIDRLQRPYTLAERAFWPCKIARMDGLTVSVSSPFRQCWCATHLKAVVIGSFCFSPFRAFPDLCLRLSSGGLAFWAGRGDLVSRRAAALDHALARVRWGR